MHGTQSMRQVIGACNPQSANLSLAFREVTAATSTSCCPERAWCVVALSMFEYYVYSINHGQESALDGRVRTHGLTVEFLHNHVRSSIYSCNHTGAQTRLVNDSFTRGSS